MNNEQNRPTRLLNRLVQGDRSAAERVLPLVYDELRGLASRQMALQPHHHTLQPTALVNEAWLKLVDQSSAQFGCRAQFYGLASKAMRSILVDHARARDAKKRGGDLKRLTLLPHDEATPELDVDVLALDESLQRLEGRDPELSRIVELRFFGGLPFPEIAQVLEMPLRTVERRWRLARAWLHRELSE